MPEGDTVWRTAQTLHTALAGQVLLRTDLRIPRLATVRLDGLTVPRVDSYGKHLFTALSDGRFLHSHLGMDGAWRVRPNNAPAPGPGHQIRAILTAREITAFGVALPVLELLDERGVRAVTSRLGPDLLGPAWDPAEAARRLSARGDRPLAEALLDQSNLAGVGNVYANELCFLRGVTPWTPVAEAGDPAAIVALAHRLLTANRDRIDRVTTGRAARGERLWVYGRRRRPCLRCGAPVRSAQQGVAPAQRVAYWCPRCQRGPSPEPRP